MFLLNTRTHVQTTYFTVYFSARTFKNIATKKELYSFFFNYQIFYAIFLVGDFLLLKYQQFINISYSFVNKVTVSLLVLYQ